MVNRMLYLNKPACLQTHTSYKSLPIDLCFLHKNQWKKTQIDPGKVTESWLPDARTTTQSAQADCKRETLICFKYVVYGRYVSHLHPIPDVDETSICIHRAS